MKQALIGAAVILAVGFGTYAWLRHEWTKDRGHQVGWAIGKMNKDRGELHVIVTREMTIIEGPRGMLGGAPQWQDWVKDHFELKDAAGQRVQMNRAGTSTVINEREAFNPEFYVNAGVRIGTTYTIDYIPVVGQPKRYRHTFTVAPEGKEFERIYFPTVDIQ